MKITQSSLSFSSRNSTIRFADDIARKVSVEFPCVSTSKFTKMKNADKFEKSRSRLWHKLYWTRDSFYKRFQNARDFESKVSSLVDVLEENKMGNCAEAALLTLLFARVNGIKNARFATVASADGKEIDHGVVIVRHKSKPYIIDSWYGFADYLPQAIQRYNDGLLSHIFKDAPDGLIQFKVLKKNVFFKKFFNREFNKEEIEYLKRIYPQMILNKKP